MVQTQPLKGKTIVVTRPTDQADEEATIIRKYGGTPYLFPTIKITPPTDLAPIKEFVADLEAQKFDFVTFTSVNGVNHLLNAAKKLGCTQQVELGLKKTVIVAIGPRTAQELKKKGIHVSLIPTRYTSEGIAEDMKNLGVKGKTIAIPRTSAANEILKQKLESMGANVKEFHVYQSEVPIEEKRKQFWEDLVTGKIDAIVFGSGLCAKNLFTILEGLVAREKLSELLNKLDVVAIGPVTAATLATLNVKETVTPQEHTFEQAIKALADKYAQKEKTQSS